MKIIIGLTVAAIAALSTSACGSPARSQAASSASTKPTATALTPASTSAPPSAAPAARLTTAQARAAYLKIVDPLNRLEDAPTNDASDDAPIGQYHSDLAAVITETRLAIRELHAVRWPTKIQPYITSMTITTMSAAIQCGEAENTGQTYSAIGTIADKSQACADSQTNQDAATIRSILDLPAPPS